MSDSAIKRRIIKARNKAVDKIIGFRCSVVLSDGNPFHIIAMRKMEIRFIRVVIDEVSEDDIDIVSAYKIMPENCTREIWCKDKNKHKFRIIPVE